MNAEIRDESNRRWDEPFGGEPLDAETVAQILAVPSFADIRAEDFPDRLPLYDIIANDGRLRSYKRGEGIWGRTKVLHPISKGGSGAFQLAARFEYVDLDDDSLINGPTNNFTTGASSLASLAARLGRGGKQTSYMLGLNWYPMDYMRFMVNYGRIEVEGGPIAALVSPLSSLPVNQRQFGVDLLQTRLQFEF